MNNSNYLLLKWNCIKIFIFCGLEYYVMKTLRKAISILVSAVSLDNISYANFAFRRKQNSNFIQLCSMKCLYKNIWSVSYLWKFIDCSKRGNNYLRICDKTLKNLKQCIGTASSIGQLFTGSCCNFITHNKLDAI